jgi:molybdopterin-guanine dinucleotide biosynthesis protein A|tara:strand:+ start:554 stop:1153 length:600 start_codon:yes stop_codon:yes gene_type:complete
MGKIIKDEITGVILAGGKARRMGGADKGLVQFRGKPLIEHVIQAFEPQVGNLLINANRNHEIYKNYGFDIVSDESEDYCGPLAGILSALNKIDTPYLATAPCDTPFISRNIVEKLSLSILSEKTEISVAHNGDRLQPVFCVMKKDLITSINNYLRKGGRKIDQWFKQHSVTIVDLSNEIKCFENFNSKEEILMSEENNE